MKKLCDVISSNGFVKRENPVQIIHGTDWWTDCDDVVALRLLCRAHNAGAVRLLGVGINSVMEFSASSLDAMLFSHGVRVPVGIDYAAVQTGERCVYQRVLSKYPHEIQSNSECENAYKLYRRLLSSCEGKADITEVGFPQIIMDLLKSEPDEISPLSGKQLVEQKVNKIWMMAGRWDEPDGKEYNLVNTERSRQAGNYICDNSPVPVVFLGFEVGLTVITGGKVLDRDDLLFKAMEAHGSAGGRCSWDPMLVLAAIINDEYSAGYATVYGTASVDSETGENNFVPHSGGRHSYLVKAKPDEYYRDMINALIR